MTWSPVTLTWIRLGQAQGAALLDDDRALGGRAGADEQRGQRAGGGSGSGVLGDAHDGIEEPGVRDGVVVSGLEAVEVGALATRTRKDSGQARGVGLGAVHRGAGADRHHQVTRPGAGHLRGNTGSEVIFGQAKRPGQFCPILDGRAEHRCRLVHRHHRAFPGAVRRAPQAPPHRSAG